VNVQRCEFLREEIKTTTEVISTFLKATDQTLALVVAFVAALATYVTKVKPVSVEPVVAVLPLVATVVAAYALRAIATIDTLGRYRASLEDVLARELGMGNIFWETMWAQRLKKSPSYRFAEGMFSLAVLVVFVGGVIGAYRAIVLPGTPGAHTQTGWFVAAAVGYGALGLFLVGVRWRSAAAPKGGGGAAAPKGGGGAAAPKGGGGAAAPERGGGAAAPEGGGGAG
jgi:hypothetical protein